MTGETQIVADGAFGVAVAGRLAYLLAMSGRAARTIPDLPAMTADAVAYVRVSWRDVGAEFDAFASAAQVTGRPFLSVAFDHPYVRVGPVIVPGTAPCHTCFTVRLRQHADPMDALADEIDRALQHDPRLGVSGHPPHIAVLAASLALVLLGPTAGAPPRPGTVARVDCGTDDVRVWPVVPVDRCPTCGPVAGPPGAASSRGDRLRALASGAGWSA